MPAVARKKTPPPPIAIVPDTLPTLDEPLAFQETARKPRKTLQEMADAGNPLGIVCRNCRKAGWTVYYTRPAQGKIVRVRICRHCKHETTTFEQEAFGG